MDEGHRRKAMVADWLNMLNGQSYIVHERVKAVPPQQMTQNDIADIIDLAVDCWHEVAESHDIKPCNCFRELFAGKMIDRGTFIGYDKL